jgi:hypothetical protein
LVELLTVPQAIDKMIETAEKDLAELVTERGSTLSSSTHRTLGWRGNVHKLHASST